MKHLFLSGTWILGSICPWVSMGQELPQSPNVIIIEADDLGYGDLSCYGAQQIQTPGMDRVAREGLRFTQGYCTAATSTPQPLFLADRKISLDESGCQDIAGECTFDH